ncbi:hypothetical protein C0214_21360 [Methylobacterium sp. DM1]|nr:hypothetical protein C0214_21360 [Methylobacterium sp. DM1]
MRLAQIYRGAASSVIAHRWPDVFGARLDHANEPLCPAPAYCEPASSLRLAGGRRRAAAFADE